MAELVMLTPTCSLNSQDITASIKSATLSVEGDAVEFTASGDNPRTFLPGLRQWSVTLELNQDYADNGLDEDLWDIWSGNAGVAIALKATSGAISTSNPEYQGTVVLTSYDPVNGAIGDPATTSVDLQGSGTLTRDVTP